MSFMVFASFRTRPLVDGGQAVHCWRGLTDSVHRYGLLQVAAVNAMVHVTPERRQSQHSVAACQLLATVAFHCASRVSQSNASQSP